MRISRSLNAKVTVGSATVIAGIRGIGEPSSTRRINEVVVLVSAQAQTLRLPDGSEDNPHPGGKQEWPGSRVASVNAVHRHAGSPANTFTDGHLVTVNPCAVPYSIASAGSSDRCQRDNRRSSPGKHRRTPQRRSSGRYSAEAGIAAARCR